MKLKKVLLKRIQRKVTKKQETIYLLFRPSVYLLNYMISLLLYVLGSALSLSLCLPIMLLYCLTFFFTIYKRTARLIDKLLGISTVAPLKLCLYLSLYLRFPLSIATNLQTSREGLLFSNVYTK